MTFISDQVSDTDKNKNKYTIITHRCYTVGVRSKLNVMNVTVPQSTAACFVIRSLENK